MIKIKQAARVFFFLFMVIALPECIEPYSPQLSDFKSLLVIDAVLTDENVSYYVKLYKTIGTIDQIAENVSGASVAIKDEQHNVAHLEEISAGIYKSDSLRFRGQAGKTYTLLITTREGKKYESDPCRLYPAPVSDSVYFTKDMQTVPGSVEEVPGVSLIEKPEANQFSEYYRWTYDECWKITIPNPSSYKYLNDSTIIPLSEINSICWKIRHSDEINIGFYPAGTTKQERSVFFFPSAGSDRLLMKYSVLVKKMSISGQEYQFWNQLKQVNESGGDIFDKQPFMVLSNIHNVDEPEEPVLGFFHVSGVTSKRLYITRNWAEANDLPLYNYNCEMIIKGVDDYPPPISPGGGMTFDKIYNLYTASGYLFTEPLYDRERNLLKLVFNTPECADCSVEGTVLKPSFWID